MDYSVTATPNLNEVLLQGGIDVFSVLLDAPATAPQIANRVSLGLAKVNYLLGELERNGWVRFAGEILHVNGNSERKYEAAKGQLQAMAGEEDSVAHRLSYVNFMLANMRSHLTKVVAQGGEPRPASLIQVTCKLSDGSAGRFVQRLHELQQEFASAEEEGETTSFSLVLSLFPQSNLPKGDEA